MYLTLCTRLDTDRKVGQRSTIRMWNICDDVCIGHQQQRSLKTHLFDKYHAAYLHSVE